jgi:hypothetical protein
MVMSKLVSEGGMARKTWRRGFGVLRRFEDSMGEEAEKQNSAAK